MVINKNVIREYPNQNYSVLFNRETGFMARVEKKGNSEPFWCEESPELIDISITNYCEKGCSFCYRNSNVKGQHMPFEDYQRIINQISELGVFQIALGGGNPNQHPDFIKILQTSYDAGIVPSYTTNGLGLTDTILEATKKYCGAIAISAYEPFSFLSDTIERVKAFKIKLNLHFLLNKNSIETAIEWLKNPPSFLEGINAIIFLNYKPINSSSELLLNKSDLITHFFDLVSQHKETFKIGFDSCSISGIVSCMKVNSIFIEHCEAARFSAFISEDLKMYPCSFMVGTPNYGNLKEQSFQKIWKENHAFLNQRDKILNNKCNSCDQRENCMGGCVFLDEINLCPNYSHAH
jgi:radical SAM protein with 4Fe4S-binding SPASM domain